jgi:hypothetical protein
MFLAILMSELGTMIIKTKYSGVRTQRTSKKKTSTT